jgi:hypothetical protein
VQSPPETPQAPPPPPPEKPRSPFPSVVAGAGAVTIVTGAILGVMALSKKDDAVSEPVQQKSMDLKDSADGLATASTVAFVIGGILVAAGATWWVLDGGLPKKGAARRGTYVTAGGIGGFFP